VALQASLLLALEPNAGSRRVRDLAAEIGVGAAYLAKILENLTRTGLLHGVRGPGGGVHLARPASEITPWEVVAAVEPGSELQDCFLGFKACDSSRPCPLHDAWSPIRSQILDMLKNRSLREVAFEARGKGVLGVEPSSQPGT